MTRVFLGFVVEAGEEFTLPDPESHHIRKVLRGRAGDAFEVVSNERRLYSAELKEGRQAVVTGEIAVTRGAPADVTLYQAVPKGRNMDLVVEKATELGVDRIVPLLTERTVVNVGEGKLDRWRRLAEAAARQSLQLRVPEVAEPMMLSDALKEASDSVLLHNGEGLPALEDAVKAPEVGLFVGPEGGWSEGEIEMADEAGLALVQLGPYRLRSETAGIVSVARAQAAMERGLAEPSKEKKGA